MLVDLGLPSGTLWSTCNLGAESPEALGVFASYGNTDTYTIDDITSKTVVFDAATYTASAGSSVTNADSGAHYLEHDAAFAYSDGVLCIPSKEQVVELFENCTIAAEDVEGTACVRFTGLNGNYIIVPLSTPYNGSNPITPANAYIPSAYADSTSQFSCGKANGSTNSVTTLFRRVGCQIRPVAV